MKNKLLAVLLAVALGTCGCAEMTDENSKTVNIVDLGGAKSSSSSAVFSSSSFFSTEFSSTDIPQSSSDVLDPLSPVLLSSSSSSSDVSNSSSSSSHSSGLSFSSSESSSSSSSSSISSSSSSSSSISSSSSSSSFKSSSSSSSSSKSSSLSSSSSKSSSSSSSSFKSSSSSSSSSNPSSSSSVVKPPAVPSNDYKALNYNEIRGVWISYLDLYSIYSSSESTFRQSLGSIFDNCVDLGINTVYFHARSHGDAFYSSSLYPRTKYVGGSYDPLQIAVEEAHKRKLSVHAWINPLRACANNTKDIQREKGYKIGEWIGTGTRAVLVNGFYYLNPAYDDVIKLIADGVTEIVSNYDVDGIHIDDYFYPTTDKSFDEQAFKESGYKSLSDFRFANCDKLVSSIYKAIKNVNKSMLFSVSPQGNVNNNYVYMYADVKKWCSEKGYLDIIMPQVYFGFNNKSQPFEKCCAEWDAIARKGNVKLVIGVAASNIGEEGSIYAGTEGKYEWINDKKILARQFLSARKLECYSGVCLYSYNSLFKPSGTVKDQVEEEKEALKNAFKNGELT